MKLTLDNDKQVFFYEQDFYVLSNFSAFQVSVFGISFHTAEHAYQYCKFTGDHPDEGIAFAIRHARSAHEAFKIAEFGAIKRRADWLDVRVGFMRRILEAKVSEHEYVERKLLATGDCELIENSWRDDFWGWGENRDGQNMLGKLWMEIRGEIKNNEPTETDELVDEMIDDLSKISKIKDWSHAFRQHWALCQQCKDHPFSLCHEGERLLLNEREQHGKP